MPCRANRRCFGWQAVRSRCTAVVAPGVSKPALHPTPTASPPLRAGVPAGLTRIFKDSSRCGGAAGERPVSGDAPLSRLRSLLVRLIGQHNGVVSAQEIDQYLDALEEPKRTSLAQLRQTILDILPEAEQGISYGVPAFKVRGKTIAGFAAFKNYLSYLPHSGSVFPQLRAELKGYSTSSGALRFSTDQPLPVPLVEKLIAVRLQQAFPA